ncbi:PadR family transcriptional regulator [candidate division KSB1 bacterium]
MKELTKIEETILLSTMRLGDDAYGVTIKSQIKKMTGRDYLYNTLYTSLEQLVKKGYLSKRFGEPTPTRGGKRKIFFNLTDAGLEALKGSFEKNKSIWAGVTEETFEKDIVK